MPAVRSTVIARNWVTRVSVAIRKSLTMPLCQGCGANYDDNYKFCPHCGRARPEPASINLNVQVAPVRYEEAVLKIEVVGTAELTEPPFDWRPSGMTKLMGEAGKNWTHITRFRLLLDSFHPQRGQYVAYQSLEFRGYVVQPGNDVTFPYRFRRNHLFKSWRDDLFQERRKTMGEYKQLSHARRMVRSFC